MSQTTNEYGQVRGEEASLRDGHAVHIAGVAGSSPASPTKISQLKQRSDRETAAKRTAPQRSGVPVRFTRLSGKLVLTSYLDGYRARLSTGQSIGHQGPRLNAELERSLANYEHRSLSDSPIRKILKNAFRAAQSRCISRDTPITISLDFLLAMYDQQEGRCAVTGIPFDVGPTNGGKTGHDRKPLRPSLDRIDPRQGYVVGNVRLVCAAVNYAMGPWGEGLFRFIAAYARHSETWR